MQEHARPFPVLIVEDEPDDVSLICRAFTRAGLPHQLSFAEDGEQAVDFLTGAGCFADRATYPLPQLVLLDLKLPRMSGLEVLEWRSRQSCELRRIPVVVLTSSRESIDVNRAYELGANTYLAKPVHFEELLGMVKQFGLYWTAAELPESPSG